MCSAIRSVRGVIVCLIVILFALLFVLLPFFIVLYFFKGMIEIWTSYGIAGKQVKIWWGGDLLFLSELMGHTCGNASQYFLLFVLYNVCFIVLNCLLYCLFYCVFLLDVLLFVYCF